MFESILFSTIAVVLLISAGAVLMVLSLIRYRKVLSDPHGQSAASRKLRILYAIHIVLMAFFIFGYLVVLASILAGIHLVSDLFVSIIFFFGAVFVLYGVVIQEKMLSSLRSTYTKSLKMLVNAVELRDPYTIGHSEHVANLLLVLRDHLPQANSSEFRDTLLEHAGLLHDIGKIGVPEDVLNKTTPLDEDEWAMIREHPAIGCALLDKLEEMDHIIDWIRYHHERVDGEGYYKLPRQTIPEVSKMIAVADTYSALITDRPYRKGKSHEEALAILAECAGSQLDEKMVAAFEAIPLERIQACRPDIVARALSVEQVMPNSGQYGETEGGRLDAILARAPGIVCLSRLLDYAVQKQMHLSLATLVLCNIKTIDDNEGRLEGDAVLRECGQELLANIRDTDVIISLDRGSFILAFTECPSSLGMHLMQRIQWNVQRADFFQPYAHILSFEKRIISFNPRDADSQAQLREFIAKYSGEAEQK